MAWLTRDYIYDITQQSGFAGDVTEATAAYIRSEMQLLVTDLRRDTMSELRIEELIYRDRELFERQPSGPDIDLNYELQQVNTKEELIGWVVTQLLIYIILSIPSDLEDNILAPWDIAAIISNNPALNQIFGGAGLDDGKLPVSITVNGNQFTHWLTMDVAMGMLLMSHTVGVDLRITMYGAPLTYFKYLTEKQKINYEDHSRTHYDYEKNMYDYTISMPTNGINQSYFFNGTDFLRGIKTVAEWSGIDHHDYWRYMLDRDNRPCDFM